MSKLAMIAVSVVMVACGPRVLTNEDGGGGGDDAPIGPHTLSAVEITPTNPIIELDLNAEEKAMLESSRKAVREVMDVLDKLG